MKCHKCPIVQECAGAKQMLEKMGYKIDGEVRMCPLHLLVKQVLSGMIDGIEEAKKEAAEKEKEESK